MNDEPTGPAYMNQRPASQKKILPIRKRDLPLRFLRQITESKVV